MKIATTSLLLALALPLSACGPNVGAQDAPAEGGSEATVEESAPEAPSTPDPSTVLARAAARWDAVVAGEWIQAYDYLPPEVRKVETLPRYLANKEHHEYRNPSKPFLLLQEDDKAYVEVNVVWETHHPQVVIAQNNPGDLAQTLHMIETWQWVDGDWYWSAVDRQKDFFKNNPELAKKIGK